MSSARVAGVCNERSGAVIGRLRVADRPWLRLRGLLGHPEPSRGEGLLIEPSNGIHTVGMRYPIDVLFLRRDGVVLRSERALPPARFVPWVRGAHSVIELPVGTIDATGTAVGDRLAIARLGRDTDEETAFDALRTATPFDQMPLALGILSGVLMGAAASALPAGGAEAMRVAPFVLAAAVDVKTRRIPNVLTASALALALTAAAIGGQGIEAVLGALAALAVGLVLHLLARGAFGLGDVKLMAGAGAMAGLAHVADFLLAMAFAGGALALLFVLARRARRTTMPYGPAIAAGAVLVLLVR